MGSIKVIRHSDVKRSISSKESMINLREHFTREGDDYCSTKKLICMFLSILIIICLLIYVFAR